MTKGKNLVSCLHESFEQIIISISGKPTVMLQLDLLSVLGRTLLSMQGDLLGITLGCRFDWCMADSSSNKD